MNIEFSWVPTLTVYDEALDNQHKQLLNQVNELIKTVLEEEIDFTTVKKVLGFLDDYTETHFRDEEHYMEKHNYPHLTEHRALHEQFKERYIKLKAKLLASEKVENITFDLENELARWWVDHIGKADKQYAEYIRAHEQ